MCGIAGVMDLHGSRPIDEDLLLRMRDSMVSRGPDEAGLYRRDGIGLAHRRLSIIDVASGQQPLSTYDGHTTITFNGEIYNYRELAKELASLGHDFATRSDTEVILHAWRQWGVKCVDRLQGMFAFAIWDKSADTLFLARDRLGIKPLYHATTSDGFLVFGSELKALIKAPKINLSLDERSIENYFTFGYVPDPETIYRGVSKLEPGCFLTATRGRAPVIEQYWDVTPSDSCPELDSDVHRELIERLSDAIKVRLVAEVPLGAFLSGGVDSSAIVALMAGMQEEPVNSCSISFEQSSHDESSYASLVAKQYSTNHRVETIDGHDHGAIDMLASVYDEPFADSSALPTLRVCELARRHVTVALSGDGADEVLAGYRRQRLHMNEERVRSLLAPQIRSKIFGPLGKYFPKADWAPRPLRAKTTLQALANDSVEAYLNSVSQNSSAVRDRLFSDSFQRQLGGYSSTTVFRRHAEKAPSDDPLTLIQYLDVKTYLPGDILTKVDRASMACSLEVRVPFLDHRFVNWCFGLHSRHRLSKGIGKIALKAAMESRLSKDLLYRNKMGFSVPLASWTRGPLKQRSEKVLYGERLRDTNLFDTNRLDKIASEHASGRSDHSTLIWSLMMFDAFLALDRGC